MKKFVIFLIKLSSLFSLSYFFIISLSHAYSDNVATCLSGKYPTLCNKKYLNSNQLIQTEKAEKRENLKTCLSGKYPSLCNHNLLTQQELKRVKRAEGNDNLKTCLSGKYPSLCKKNLLTSEQLKSTEKAEKAENLKTCLSGNYRSLCKKNLLTQKELDRVNKVEKEVNLRTCISGKYPSLCNIKLLNEKQICQFYDTRKEFEVEAYIRGISCNSKKIVKKEEDISTKSSGMKKVKDTPETDTYETTYFEFPNPFKTNLLDENAYLQIRLGLMTQYEARVMDAVDQHQPSLTSSILSTIKKLRCEDIMNNDGRNGMKEFSNNLLKSINLKLEELGEFPGIEGVYFTSFITQGCDESLKLLEQKIASAKKEKQKRIELQRKAEEEERKRKLLEKRIAELEKKNKELQKPKQKQPPKSRGGSGSGFFISKLGHIITNEHVVKKCNKITIGDNIDRQVPAKLIEIDRKNDLALLRTTTLDLASSETKSLIKKLSTQKLGIEIVPLATAGLMRSDDVELGEDIVVAGFPFGDIFSKDIKVTFGNVNSTKGVGDDSSQFQIQAPVQIGNSGGPIYDKYGNIVGVVVAQLDKLKMAKTIGSLPENVNFGIKASTVKQFLNSSGLPTKWAERKKEMSNKEISKIASKQTVMVVCHR